MGWLANKWIIAIDWKINEPYGIPSMGRKLLKIYGNSRAAE